MFVLLPVNNTNDIRILVFASTLYATFIIQLSQKSQNGKVQYLFNSR